MSLSSKGLSLNMAGHKVQSGNAKGTTATGSGGSKS